MPATYRDWIDQAAWTLRSEWTEATLTGPVRVEACMYDDAIRILVQNWTQVRSKLRGDIDNYGKSVLDALQYATVIADDRQVQDVRFYFGDHEE